MHALCFVLQAVLAHGALAIPHAFERRDLASIQGAIGSVQSALKNLDTAVNALSTDPSTAPPVLTASQDVQAAIEKATKDISASQPLELTEAIGLQQTASDLTSAVQTTVNGLVAKKPVLDQLGVATVAVTTLQSQKTASAALGSAIVSKVPAIGQGIAQQSIDQVNTILDKGIQDLQGGGAGAGAGGGAGNGTAGAEPSVAPPSSSTSAAAPPDASPSSLCSSAEAPATSAAATTTAAAPAETSPISAPELEMPTATATATATATMPAGGVGSPAPGAGGATGPIQGWCPCACTCQAMVAMPMPA